MLSDEDTYKKVEADPTPKIQNAVNKCLRGLKKEEYITEAEYKTLIRHNNLSPKLYCLRNVHKRVLNLVPIVSCVKSPTYNIGKYLHNILNSTWSTSIFNLKNYFSLTTILTDIKVPPGYMGKEDNKVCVEMNRRNLAMLGVIKFKL